MLKGKSKKSQEEAANTYLKELVNNKGEVIHPEKCEIGPNGQEAWFEAKDDEFTLTIESYNNQTPKQILKQALDILEQKSKEALEAIK